MYTLTESRFSKVQEILDRYRTELYAEGSHSHEALEGELREALKISPENVKGLYQEVFVRFPRYKYVAAYSMHHLDDSGAVREFRPMLRELYKSPRDQGEDLDAMGAAFWDRFKSKKAMALRKEIDELRHSPGEASRLETMRAELRSLTGELY